MKKRLPSTPKWRQAYALSHAFGRCKNKKALAHKLCQTLLQAMAETSGDFGGRR